MNYIRVYAGPDGESHFAEVEVALPPVPFVPGKPPIGFAAPIPVTALNFVAIPTDWDGEWHPTPRRQFWCTLAGEALVTTSDGEQRHLTPGTVVLLEDQTGKGHNTRVVGTEAYFGALMPQRETWRPR